MKPSPTKLLPYSIYIYWSAPAGYSIRVWTESQYKNSRIPHDTQLLTIGPASYKLASTLRNRLLNLMPIQLEYILGVATNETHPNQLLVAINKIREP